jgi:hypothetical protein
LAAVCFGFCLFGASLERRLGFTRICTFVFLFFRSLAPAGADKYIQAQLVQMVHPLWHQNNQKHYAYIFTILFFKRL